MTLRCLWPTSPETGAGRLNVRFFGPRTGAVLIRGPAERDTNLGGRDAERAVTSDDGPMEFGRYKFGSIEIDGVTYEHDVVIEGGRIRKRKKGPSKALRGRYGHTPLTAAEDIPWPCRRLVLGSGASGSLPVADDVITEAERRGVELIVMPTVEAIEQLRRSGADTNAVLHVTC